MRWELMTDHYLNCPDVEWEQNETDLVSGRVARKRFKVPEYLLKGTTVCHDGLGQRGDRTFFGDPTPDMTPLDPEAETLSESFREHWAYKPDGGDVSYSQSVISGMAEALSRPVQIPGLAELTAAVAESTKSNQEVLKTVLKVRLT